MAEEGNWSYPSIGIVVAAVFDAARSCAFAIGSDSLTFERVPATASGPFRSGADVGSAQSRWRRRSSTRSWTRRCAFFRRIGVTKDPIILALLTSRRPLAISEGTNLLASNAKPIGAKTKRSAARSTGVVDLAPGFSALDGSLRRSPCSIGGRRRRSDSDVSPRSRIDRRTRRGVSVLRPIHPRLAHRDRGHHHRQLRYLR